MIIIKLRQLLWDRGLTAADVHRATGISTSILSDIIQGKHTNIGLDMVNRFCMFLNCSLDDLLEFKPDIQQPSEDTTSD